jgi:hypothetical protein
MGAETFDGTPKHKFVMPIEILKRPSLTVEDGAAIQIFAVEKSLDGGPDRAVGYVATKAGKQGMLGEFSGKPLGTYAPVNAVIGRVDDNEVYRKQVTTDAPLSGLRTAIAKRRAARKVKSFFKL